MSLADRMAVNGYPESFYGCPVFFLTSWTMARYCFPVVFMCGDALKAVVACCQRFLWA